MQWKLIKKSGNRVIGTRLCLTEKDAQDDGEQWLKTQKTLYSDMSYKVEKITNLLDFK